jgi:outer membrane lipoprotein-sorting protein
LRQSGNRYTVAPWSAHLFSEGTALYLWQIRHNPNRPQTLLKLTIVAAVCSVVAVSLLLPVSFVAGKADEGAEKKAVTEITPSPAAEFLQRVRHELPKHQSIKADLAQSVSLGDQQFKITGQYLSAGLKMRLKYTVVREQGTDGEMLEVCDGKELWTVMELPGSKSLPATKRITRRNIQQIRVAVAAQNRNPAGSVVNLDLGLGGLTALLASLQNSMDFDAMKEDETDGHSRTILQGRWKKELLKDFPKDKDDALPAYLPDLVRLYVDTQTLFPVKLLYLKKIPTKKTFKPLVSLEFHDVEFDVPVEEKEFTFAPEGTDVEDVTKQYLDRLTNAAAGVPATK